MRFSLFVLLLFTAVAAFAQNDPISEDTAVASVNLRRSDILAGFQSFPSSRHKSYVAKVFDCDEHKKLRGFTLLLTPEASIAFGSNAAVTGRRNIETMLRGFNNRFAHLSQHLQRVYLDSPDEIVYSADATYHFSDGRKTIAIPYMVHLRFKGELVSDYRIYIDLAPFYSMAAKK